MALNLDSAWRVAGLVEGLPTEVVHQRLDAHQGDNERTVRALAFYLAEMADRRLHDATGHPDTAAYAEMRLHMKPRRARELVAAGRALRELAMIDHAFLMGVLSWSQVLLLLRVAVPKTQMAWIRYAHAKETCRALAESVAVCSPGDMPRDPEKDDEGLPQRHYEIHERLTPLAHAMLENALAKLSDERGRPVTIVDLITVMAEVLIDSKADGTLPGRTRLDESLYKVVLHEVRGDGRLLVQTENGLVPVDGGEGDLPETRKVGESLLCDAEPVPMTDQPGGARPAGRPHVDVKTPGWMRRRVLARDGHRCRACGSRWRLMAHHIVFRAHGGPTRLHGLLTLCARCHAMVHGGMLVIRGRTERRASFHDAKGRLVSSRQGRVSEETLERILLEAAEDLLGPRAARPAPATLDAFPRELDAASWARYAPLFEVRDGALVLRRGAVMPEASSGKAEGDPVRADPHLARAIAWHEAHRVAGAARARASGVPTEPAPVEAETPDPVPAVTATPRREEEVPSTAEAFPGVVGRGEVLDRLRDEAVASRRLGEPFAHTLLVGPPGMGKTTLAEGIARLTGGELRATVGTLLGDVPSLVKEIVGMKDGDVLFIDEVHSAPASVLELLHEAMSQRQIGVPLHESTASTRPPRRMRIRLAAFTVVAATTEEGALPPAFLSRFPLRQRLSAFERLEMLDVVEAIAREKGAPAACAAAELLAEASRGVPRMAEQLVTQARKEAALAGARGIDLASAHRALSKASYEMGFWEDERRYMKALYESRGPMSLARLAAATGSDARHVARAVEPWLLERRLVQVTPHGRVPGPRVPRGLAASGAGSGT